jgi:hypothetical protein
LKAAAAAAARIQRGREAARDPELSLFPEPADLFHVLHYVTRRRRVPQHVLREDAKDVFVILEALRGEWERLTLAAIRFARGLEKPIPWAELAVLMRTGTPQGAQQTLRRLESLLADEHVPGRRSERVAIAAAREAAVAAEQVKAEEQAAAAERERLRTPLALFLRAVGEHRDQLDDDIVEDVDDLAAKVHGRAVIPESAIAQARLLCDELEGRPTGQLPDEVLAAVGKVRPVLPARRVSLGVQSAAHTSCRDDTDHRRHSPRCQAALGPSLVRDRTTWTTWATASASGTPLRCDPSR